ncbi:MAG: MOSC domain-containing protein [Alphaproteobacteria bacterium]|nr:MOSC domain-containing protein [Alphaproteobacteria bacterium]
MSIIVSALALYPVKGAAGTAVEQLEFDRFGPIGDRRWLVVDEAGHFLTQREHPRLAVVAPTMVPGGLRLTVPDGGVVEVPTPAADAATRPVVIWRDTVLAADAGDAAAALLSAHLGAAVRLVGCTPAYQRQVDLSFARPGDQVTFADGFPALLIGEASLAELNHRGAMDLPMTRFRPNIVLRGTTPFEEDGWRQVRIGTALFDTPKPCARCAVPTVDQATGTVTGKEPLKTLATFRRGPNGAVLFGMNAILREGTSIAVGDEVVGI